MRSTRNNRTAQKSERAKHNGQQQNTADNSTFQPMAESS